MTLHPKGLPFAYQGRCPWGCWGGWEAAKIRRRPGWLRWGGGWCDAVSSFGELDWGRNAKKCLSEFLKSWKYKNYNQRKEPNMSVCQFVM